MNDIILIKVLFGSNSSFDPFFDIIFIQTFITKYISHKKCLTLSFIFCFEEIIIKQKKR